MNTPTSAHAFGAWLVLLAIANMAMFIRMAINKRRPAKIFVTIYSLATIPIVVAYAHFNHIEQVGTLLFGLVTLLTPLTLYCTVHRNSLHGAVIEAPLLSKWILNNFKALDGDGDGQISSGDLISYCENPEVDLDKLGMARKVQYALYDIGHVTDVMTASYPAIGISVVFVYAINAADAESYPARLSRAEKQEYFS
ncbi:hypothetical protein BH11CYA1_BH11CYA1_15620 [soil metagenome]